MEAAAEPPEEQVEVAEAAEIAVPRADAHGGKFRFLFIVRLPINQLLNVRFIY